jgi:hypothetical protein
MDINNNPARRTAFIWTGIILVGIIIIFIPSLTGMDGFNGGFALSFLGGFISLIGLIAAIIYFRMAGILDKTVKKENILVHWTYAPEEWKTYTKTEHKEDTSTRKGLFLMVLVISALVCGVMAAVVRDDYLIFFLIFLGIVAITGITALATGWSNYRNNQARLGEVYITLDGLYLNKQLHVWKGLGNSLEAIAFEEEYRAQPRIKVDYSSPARTGRNYYTARVPVPPGQEEVARKIVAEIAAAHLNRPLAANI